MVVTVPTLEVVQRESVKGRPEKLLEIRQRSNVLVPVRREDVEEELEEILKLSMEPMGL